MSILFRIISLSSGSLVWGILIGVLFMGLFLFLVKGWYRSAVFSPGTWITGILLGILLSFQCVLIVGSITIIRVADAYEPLVTEAVAQVADITEDYVSEEESREIVSRFLDNCPIAGCYISEGSFTGYTPAELPSAIMSSLKSHMRWYIGRRILWCLLFVAVAAVIAIKSLRGAGSSRRSGSRMRAAMATAAPSPRRSSHYVERRRPPRRR